MYSWSERITDRFMGHRAAECLQTSGFQIPRVPIALFLCHRTPGVEVGLGKPKKHTRRGVHWTRRLATSFGRGEESKTRLSRISVRIAEKNLTISLSPFFFLHTSFCLLRNSPCSTKGPIFTGSTGSNISLRATQLVMYPTMAPPAGSVHGLSYRSHANICTTPSRNPIEKPLENNGTRLKKCPRVLTWARRAKATDTNENTWEDWGVKGEVGEFFNHLVHHCMAPRKHSRMHFGGSASFSLRMFRKTKQARFAANRSLSAQCGLRGVTHDEHGKPCHVNRAGSAVRSLSVEYLSKVKCRQSYKKSTCRPNKIMEMCSLVFFRHQ